jgi:hypothetical protein
VPLPTSVQYAYNIPRSRPNLMDLESPRRCLQQPYLSQPKLKSSQVLINRYHTWILTNKGNKALQWYAATQMTLTNRMLKKPDTQLMRRRLLYIPLYNDSYQTQNQARLIYTSKRHKSDFSYGWEGSMWGPIGC